jgi:hypothetical protein
MRSSVLASFETADGMHCVDFFEREDGSFGFEQYRGEYDGSGQWQSLNKYSQFSFASGPEALQVAKQHLSWLVQAEVWRWQAAQVRWRCRPMKKSAATKGESPSRLIDARIKDLDDWRGKTLSHVRALIKQADPEVVEEWKWSVPVWSHDGIICTGETYKSAVKLTFAKGASLNDPSGLFNSSLEGNTRRAIDIHAGDDMNEDAFKTLIRAAAALNKASAR